jgi:hypothetical protein
MSKLKDKRSIRNSSKRQNNPLPVSPRAQSNILSIDLDQNNLHAYPSSIYSPSYRSPINS